MGRITDSDANNLMQVSDLDRSKILYKYLVSGKNQKTIAEEVFHDYGDWASMRVSVVTRGYGFHEGRGRGRYPSIPKEIIIDFVREYAPEDYYEGLDEGTFDDFLRAYRQQLAAQQQREAQQRQRQAEENERRRQQQAAEAERQRQQQLERERQQREWAAQQEAMRRKQEAERRAREEAERQERIRQERERQAKEAARQAAKARGDHETLMNQAFDDLKNGNFALAKSKAEKAWDIQPMIGLQYIFARCCAEFGQKKDAIRWAVDALEGYEAGSSQYLDLCRLFFDQGGSGGKALHYARQLYEYGQLSRLTDAGLATLARQVCKHFVRLSGGLHIFRLRQPSEGDLNFAETVALLIANRFSANDQNRALLLDCAFLLTRQEQYGAALDIYKKYYAENRLGPAYDLRAHQGMCYYGLGDKVSAQFLWFPNLLNIGRFDTAPLDAVCFNYRNEALDTVNQNPQAQQQLDFAQDYLNGTIPGSVYYNGILSPWQQALGLEPDQETRWYCEDNGEWFLEIFTPDPAEVMKDKVKGFFGKLFGR